MLRRDRRWVGRSADAEAAARRPQTPERDSSRFRSARAKRCRSFHAVATFVGAWAVGDRGSPGGPARAPRGSRSEDDP
jgi:hypothetical protein